MASFKEQSAFCPHCQRQVLARREDVPHTFWLIASLFSCGLFAIVWMILILMNNSKPFLCPNCGTQVVFNANAPMRTVGGSNAAQGFQQTTKPPMSKAAILIFGVIAVFVGFSLFIKVIGEVGGSSSSVPSPSTQSTPNESQLSTNSAQSAQLLKTDKDYKLGYKEGFAGGTQDAKNISKTGGYMMNQEAIHAIAIGNSDSAKVSNKQNWIKGFEDGFADGFKNYGDKLRRK